MTMKQPYYNTEVTKMTSKKTILTVSLLIIFLLSAFCFSAGCIFSEPDPVVGTYVYTEYNDPSANANPNQGPVVGSFRHIENAIKVYENGTLLYSYYADGRVGHYIHTWEKVDDGHYIFVGGSMGGTKLYYYDYYLSPDGNKLTTPVASGNKTYIRNDSYVIPDVWP